MLDGAEDKLAAGGKTSIDYSAVVCWSPLTINVCISDSTSEKVGACWLVAAVYLHDSTLLATSLLWRMALRSMSRAEERSIRTFL